jgi:DNA-directed RNA polymerase subunit beta'
MMQKISITKQGTTPFLEGEQVDKYDFQRENEKARAAGGTPAEGEPVLLGITKASLETESFISSASFQDTTRILTDAATLGKTDWLRGFKENVITGHLIPAGTGTARYQSMYPEKLGEEIPFEFPEQEEEDDIEVMEDNTASEVDEIFGDNDIFDENEMGLSEDILSSISEADEEE